MKKSVGLTVVGLLAVVIALFGLPLYRYSHPTIVPMSPEQLSQFGAILYPTPRTVPQVPLTTHLGTAFNFDHMKGHWSLIHFGYTHCPEFCPTNMAQIDQTQQRLIDLQMPSIGKYLVTMDPERDTPAVLDTYINGFGIGWTALWTPEPALTALARSLNTVFFIDLAKAHDQDPTHGYLVDHSDNIALLDPEGKVVGIFRPPHTPATMAAVISNLMQTTHTSLLLTP